MTPPDIDAIQARADAATPGPWTWADGLVTAPGDEIVWWPANATEDSPLGACGEHAEAHEADNFAFVAHAREDVPALIAQIRHLHGLRRSTVTITQEDDVTNLCVDTPTGRIHVNSAGPLTHERALILAEDHYQAELDGALIELVTIQQGGGPRDDDNAMHRWFAEEAISALVYIRLGQFTISPA